ncbi:hypothetical protein [Thermococcus sp. AM4]|uniref:hypothetical protein n=1 Tax=Thermococcus sp. (strain AM4) TaxID=246969 RepID=UPI0001871196|nr:hypothetical protein [Thermococcus sp. AM4]EEB74360.1 hypothetical protein TAM4_1727 [Thermococcus sp. AM4]
MNIVKALFVFLFVFLLLLGGLAYTKHTKNERLKDPKFVYEHYLKTYEAQNYTLLGVYFELDRSSILNPWKPKWEFYLYNSSGKLVKLTITPDGESKEKAKTILNYTNLTVPINQVQNLPKYEERFREIVYLPREGKLIDHPARGYSDFRKVCVKLSRILDNRTFKLIKTIRGGVYHWLTLKNTSIVGGVFTVMSSTDPLCEGTWLVVEPYNETHDLVKVIYPHGNASTLVKALNLPVFQGKEYLGLLKKVEAGHCSAVEGTLVNATGIYVNPHAQEIFNQTAPKAIKERRCFTIIQVIVLKNGTVKTWARGTIWCARGD